MAYPFIFRANFEEALSTEWDVAESDTGSLLDRAHYSDLAGVAGQGPLTPWRGAYCMRINLHPADTNNHTVGDGDIDIATGVERFFLFYLFISSDFTATANDNFSIFELQQAGGTQEFVVGLRVLAASPNDVNLWVAINDTPETHGAVIPKGQWLAIEVQANVDTAAANGDITVYVNGVSNVSLATPVQNAGAVGQGILGTQVTAATTTGTLLFDEFIMDDARIFPRIERFPQKIRLYKTGHVFIGPGWINDIAILSATGTCALYDTDTGYTSDASAVKVDLDAAGNYISWDEPVYFERGCYASIGGTNPQVEVNLQVTHHEPGQFGPRYHWSDGAIRRYGQLRLPRPQNT